MIVIRLFDCPVSVVAQFGIHRFCCLSGDCAAPDEVTYSSAQTGCRQGDEVGEVLVRILHEWASERDDHYLSDALQNRLETHRVH